MLNYLSSAPLEKMGNGQKQLEIIGSYQPSVWAASPTTCKTALTA